MHFGTSQFEKRLFLTSELARNRSNTLEFCIKKSTHAPQHTATKINPIPTHDLARFAPNAPAHNIPTPAASPRHAYNHPNPPATFRHLLTHTARVPGATPQKNKPHSPTAVPRPAPRPLRPSPRICLTHHFPPFTIKTEGFFRFPTLVAHSPPRRRTMLYVLIVLLLASFVFTFLGARTWHWGYVILVEAIFLASVGAFLLAAETLRINAVYRAQINKTQKEVDASTADIEALKSGTHDATVLNRLRAAKRQPRFPTKPNRSPASTIWITSC